MRACDLAGCGRRHKAHGLCQAHLQRLKRGANLDQPIQKRRPKGPPPPQCTVRRCWRPSRAKRLCTRHYDRERRHGDRAPRNRPWSVEELQEVESLARQSLDTRLSKGRIDELARTLQRSYSATSRQIKIARRAPRADQ